MSYRDSASGSSTFHGGGGMSGNNGNVGAGTGGSGSNNSGSRTGGLGGGLSTGNTWHGNTAFGPSGGMAQGYATMRDGGGMFGVGPSMETYSNFKDPTGKAMVGGGVQNRAVTARSPQQALGMLRALQQPAVAPSGGLLGPDPSVQPTAAPPPQISPSSIQQLQRIHAMLGGGGMLAYGQNPAIGGSWTPAGLGYYGGYGATGNGSTNGSTYDKNSNFADGYGGGSTHYKDRY